MIFLIYCIQNFVKIVFYLYGGPSAVLNPDLCQESHITPSISYFPGEHAIKPNITHQAPQIFTSLFSNSLLPTQCNSLTNS